MRFHRRAPSISAGAKSLGAGGDADARRLYSRAAYSTVAGRILRMVQALSMRSMRECLDINSAVTTQGLRCAAEKPALTPTLSRRTGRGGITLARFYEITLSTLVLKSSTSDCAESLPALPESVSPVSSLAKN